MSYASVPPPVSEEHQQAAKATVIDFELRWRENHRWEQFKWHLYLLCLRLFYRRFSKVIHYFGMHRMKRLRPMGGEPFYRCDWCGMHGTKVEIGRSLTTAPDPQSANIGLASGNSSRRSDASRDPVGGSIKP